jgi:hypothetical protein
MAITQLYEMHRRGAYLGREADGLDWTPASSQLVERGVVGTVDVEGK